MLKNSIQKQNEPSQFLSSNEKAAGNALRSWPQNVTYEWHRTNLSGARPKESTTSTIFPRR